MFDSFVLCVCARAGVHIAIGLHHYGLLPTGRAIAVAKPMLTIHCSVLCCVGVLALVSRSFSSNHFQVLPPPSRSLNPYRRYVDSFADMNPIEAFTYMQLLLKPGAIYALCLCVRAFVHGILLLCCSTYACVHAFICL